MAANHGSLRKKVVCFNNIVSFSLTTNPPKEARGMACDVFLQRIIANSHGVSVPFRAIPLLSYFVYGFLHRSLTDVFCVSPCHSVAMIFCLCFFCIGVSRIFTDVFRAIPLHRQLRLMLVATGFTRLIRVHP